MKIPFDIKFRPQIESGEYKVETRNGSPVRIICWDRKYGYPIIGLAYEKATGCESYVNAYADGTTSANGKMELLELYKDSPIMQTAYSKRLEKFIKQKEELLNRKD